MKHLLQTSTLFAGFLLSAGLSPASTFNVPFDFEASGRVMPAGRYQVERMSLTSPAFRITSRETGKAAIVSMPIAVTDDRAENARMVFHCKGGECAVAEIWPNAGAGGKRIVTPKAVKPVVVDVTN